MAIYIMFFIENELNGNGKIIYSFGDTCIGQFRNNKLIKGKIIYKEGHFEDINLIKSIHKN